MSALWQGLCLPHSSQPQLKTSSNLAVAGDDDAAGNGVRVGVISAKLGSCEVSLHDDVASHSSSYICIFSLILNCGRFAGSVDSPEGSVECGVQREEASAGCKL